MLCNLETNIPRVLHVHLSLDRYFEDLREPSDVIWNSVELEYHWATCLQLVALQLIVRPLWRFSLRESEARPIEYSSACKRIIYTRDRLRICGSNANEADSSPCFRRERESQWTNGNDQIRNTRRTHHMRRSKFTNEFGRLITIRVRREGDVIHWALQR